MNGRSSVSATLRVYVRARVCMCACHHFFRPNAFFSSWDLFTLSNCVFVFRCVRVCPRQIFSAFKNDSLWLQFSMFWGTVLKTHTFQQENHRALKRGFCPLTMTETSVILSLLGAVSSVFRSHFLSIYGIFFSEEHYEDSCWIMHLFRNMLNRFALGHCALYFIIQIIILACGDNKI